MNAFGMLDKWMRRSPMCGCKRLALPQETREGKMPKDSVEGKNRFFGSIDLRDIDIGDSNNEWAMITA